MHFIKLAWKNILSDPLNLILNLVLLALGIGLINFILLVNDQLKDKFENNLAGVDLVIGAKGSPLQLILSSMYHIDAPTGNVSLAEAKPFLREGHPLLEATVPLSMGDNHKGFRIIGTDHAILPLYEAELAEGVLWNGLYEVTIGHYVAQDLNLKLGSTFISSHGFADDEELAHEHGQLKVVGILKPTGSVIDQLILVSTESVWAVHDHDHAEGGGQVHEESAHNHTKDDGHNHQGHDHDHDHSHEGHDHSGYDHNNSHEDHNHDGHDHNHNHDSHDHDEHHDHHNHHSHASAGMMSRTELLEQGDKEITSILVKYKSKTNYRTLQMGRNINENTDLQAAAPAYEINRLYDMMGIGTKALQLLAILIAIVSGISIFVSLLSSLKKRKYELSLLRVMGGSRRGLFFLILIEGLILALLGFILGMLVSHLCLHLLGGSLEDRYNYPFHAWATHGKEGLLLLTALGLGMIAALIPAFMAYKTDIHETLSDG